MNNRFSMLAAIFGGGAYACQAMAGLFRFLAALTLRGVPRLDFFRVVLQPLVDRFAELRDQAQSTGLVFLLVYCVLIALLAIRPALLKASLRVTA